jgi:predicted TPR repeat methyltransferase
VAQVRPWDLNIVLQTPRLAPFDLVIGTNVFLYYDALEKGLARANVSAMLKPGGFLVTNTVLATAAPVGLADSLRTDIAIGPGVTDYTYTYRKQN